MIRIATVNVNGIRASVRRGLGGWLDQRGCDVVALQEVRCPTDQLPEGILDGWHMAYDQGQLAGRNGVAIVSRERPLGIRMGFGNREFDLEGRYVEADFEHLTIGCLYLPKGATQEDDPAKYARKQRFMRSFARYLSTARGRCHREEREFLLMGDLNIAHEKWDLKNHAANARNEGFLPEEREWLGTLLGPRKLIDVVRVLHGEQKGPYSWWSWRGQAFTNDAGWRIDFHLATKRLADTAITAVVDRAATYEERTSDHSPVVVDYDFTL